MEYIIMESMYESMSSGKVDKYLVQSGDKVREGQPVAEIIAENFINLFKAGNQLNVKALLLDGREVTITFSLSGFTAAYNKISKSCGVK